MRLGSRGSLRLDISQYWGAVSGRSEDAGGRRGRCEMPLLDGRTVAAYSKVREDVR